MSFDRIELENINNKILQTGVVDASEVSQWYESRFPYEFTITKEQILSEFDIVKQYPAANKTQAINASNAVPNIIQNLSSPANAIRLTPIPGTNKSTYAAYETYNNMSSNRLKNWISPQKINLPNGLPSRGYSINLYDGNPNTGGRLITTTEGASGSGSEATVSWLWNYDLGLLFLSNEFRETINDPYVTGFRYIGKLGFTINNIDIRRFTYFHGA